MTVGRAVVGVLAGVVVGVVVLAACTAPNRSAAPSRSAAPVAPHDCPTAPAGPAPAAPAGQAAPASAPAGQAAPAGQPGQPGPAGSGIAVASSVAPSDTSTSVVLTNLTGPQIQCGKTGLDSYSDVLFATRTGPGGQPHPLKMDIQAPQGVSRAPLVVYVTGGGFISAGKTNGLNLRSYVAEAGFVVASVEYRTVSDGATWVDGVSDVKAAIRYLRAHADQYRIDPARVAVWGESAGGYLASLVGVTAGMSEFDVGENLGQSSAVRAVVDKFGPSDLARLSDDFDPATRRAWLAPDTAAARYAGVGAGRSLLDNPSAVAGADPISYVDRSDPPFLLMHGSADTLVSPSQTLLLHTALRAAGVDSTRLVLTGANHGDLAFLGNPAAALPWSTQEVMDRLVQFLHTHLAPA